MIEYIVDDRKFSLSYKELKESYEVYCMMSDKEFLEDISGALHLACIISYLKELPTDMLLCDTGLIHELAHLIHIPDSPVNSLTEIRELFKKILELK